MVKKKKKKKKNQAIRLFHSERWPRKHRFGEQAGRDLSPLLHPFSLRKSKGRVIARLISRDKSLSDFRNPSN